MRASKKDNVSAAHASAKRRVVGVPQHASTPQRARAHVQTQAYADAQAYAHAQTRADAQAKPCSQPRPKRSRKLMRVAAAALAAVLLVGGSYVAYAAAVSGTDATWYMKDRNATEFTISTPGELRALSEIVNGTAQVVFDESSGSTLSIQDDFAGKTVHLAKSVSLSMLGSTEFSPIGTQDSPFKGTFDGGGNTVNGLSITQAQSNAGLFGVVAEGGVVQNLTVSGAITMTDVSQPVCNIGGVVGDCQGSLSGAISNVNISLCSVYVPTVEAPEAISKVGGVVGHAAQTVSGCSYGGSLQASSAQQAVIDDEQHSWAIASCIGGVAGLLGNSTEATPGVSMDSCRNTGTLYLDFTGAGGLDLQATASIAKPHAVGGVVGYSSGSVRNCSNAGEVRASTRDTSDEYGYDACDDNGGNQVGGVVGALRTNIGKENQVSSTWIADPGIASDVITVENCYNTGMVIGAARVGGIVGGAGSYTVITKCANGNFLENNDAYSGQFRSINKGAVVSTRWNKPMAGGIVGSTVGDVTFCYNRAEVNNTQAGFYCAGIAGGLGTDQDESMRKVLNDSSYEPEMHSCWNSGIVGRGHQQSQKFGSILGNNEGYVHDCVAIGATVVTGQGDGADVMGTDLIGDQSWRHYDNLNVMSFEDLQTEKGLAVLNNYALRDASNIGDYWVTGYQTAESNGSFVGSLAYRNNDWNDGYPVLLSWIGEVYGTTDLSNATLEQIGDAEAAYSAVSEPTPAVSLQMLNADGSTTMLYQNVDFVVLPQEGAFERTLGTSNPYPYQYSIVGIGTYCGSQQNVGYYGIGMGTLDGMTVDVSKGVFNWNVQFPETVSVTLPDGTALPQDEFSYRIYDSNTNNLTSSSSAGFVVFDSAGYVVLDDGTRVEGLEAAAAIAADENANAPAFKVYDRDGRLISDSTGAVYDPETGNDVTGTIVNTFSLRSGSNSYTVNVTAGSSCIGSKSKVENALNGNDGEEGYVVEVLGEGAYEGSSLTGRFKIDRADLTECIVTIVYDGCTYIRDAETNVAEDAEGRPLETDFTGESIKPDMSLEYMGKTLTQTDYNYINEDTGVAYNTGAEYRDYYLEYGPKSSEVTIVNPVNPNRNATSAIDPDPIENMAAVTAVYSSGSNVPAVDGKPLANVGCFKGNAICQFGISSVSINDASRVTVDFTDQAVPAEGETLDSPVRVTLVTQVSDTEGKINTITSMLKEGTDYTVSYKDEDGAVLSESPAAKGTYTAVVTPSGPNMTGSPVEGVFSIADAQTFTVAGEQREDPWGGQAIYIPDTTWDATKLYPQLSFVDANGDELDLVEGRDYEYEIYTKAGVYDYSGGAGKFTGEFKYSLYKNVRTGEALPYLNWDYADSRQSYAIKVKGRGCYAGVEQEVMWEINKRSLDDTQASDWEVDAYVTHSSSGSRDVIDHNLKNSTVIYKGAELSGISTFSAYFRSDEEEVHAGDYVSVRLEVSFDKFFEDGSLTLRGDGPDGTFKVHPFDISSWSQFKPQTSGSLVYTGNAIEPVTVNDMEAGVDYRIVYEDNVDAGAASYMVAGMGDFTGERSGSFTITSKTLNLNSSSFQVSPIEDQVFTGEQIRPPLVIIDSDYGMTLEEGVDYELSYGTNVSGQGTVVVKGIGNYTTPLGEEIVQMFRIVATDWMYGDTNDDGVVDSADASLILKYRVRAVSDDDINLDAADVSGDGSVDSVDASLVLQYRVHLISEFPTESHNSKND